MTNKYQRALIKQRREHAKDCPHTQTHVTGTGVYCDQCKLLVRTLTMAEFMAQLKKESQA